MNKFIKENWFKLGILIIASFLAISWSYYSLIFIPEKEQARLELQAEKEQAALELQREKMLATEQVRAENEDSLNNCLEDAKDKHNRDGNAIVQAI